MFAAVPITAVSDDCRPSSSHTTSWYASCPFSVITENGQEAYHDVVCDELGLQSSETAVMGTAANMNYVAITTEKDDDLDVTAIVTAGVQTNAVCAGDPSSWRETAEGFKKVAAVAGTINTILLINRSMTPAALARTVMTMTEGKSAALQRLAVPSCYSADLATGTGTDQYCVAAPLHGDKPLTSASPRSEEHTSELQSHHDI